MNGACQGGEKTGIVVGHGRACKCQPELPRCLPRFEIQIVQDLEMIGDKARRADDHPLDSPARQFRENIQQRRPDPRLGSASGALPGKRPVGKLSCRATASAVSRTCAG